MVAGSPGSRRKPRKMAMVARKRTGMDSRKRRKTNVATGRQYYAEGGYDALAVICGT
jgi:hypothetical protein